MISLVKGEWVLSFIANEGKVNCEISAADRERERRKGKEVDNKKPPSSEKMVVERIEG